MILYIYKNNFCDPANGVGIAKQFSHAEDVDEYVKLFVASIQPKFFSNWRIFVTNDDVDFVEIDHFVLIDDHYKLNLGGERIKELSIHDIAMQVNSAYREQQERRAEARANADKLVKDAKQDESVRDSFRKSFEDE